MAEALSTFERVLKHVDGQYGALTKTLERLAGAQADLASEQARMGQELHDLRTSCEGRVEQHDGRLGAIDNVKNGALVTIRKDVSTQGECIDRRINRQNRRILLTIITSLVAVVCILLAAHFRQGERINDATETTHRTTLESGPAHEDTRR